jgi:hypothetical protein
VSALLRQRAAERNPPVRSLCAGPVRVP